MRDGYHMHLHNITIKAANDVFRINNSPFTCRINDVTRIYIMLMLLCECLSWCIK
jgi:hypothetical protein